MTKEQQHDRKLQEEEAKRQLPAEQLKRDVSVVDYGEDAGAGFQNQSKDDVALPFIDILQPGSPEVQGAERDGARAGMIINRVTGEVFEALDTISDAPGIIVVPSITEHLYTEWKPKKGPNDELLKGGFVGRHELVEPVVKEAREKSPFKAFRLPNGNDLLETFYVYGLQLFDDGSTAPVAMAFGSTKIRAYKSWMYIARAIQVLTPSNNRANPPLYSHAYRIRTKKKVEGSNTWYIPVIGFTGADAESSRYTPDDAVYQAARAVEKAYLSGAVKPDYSKTGAESVGGDADPKKAPF